MIAWGVATILAVRGVRVSWLHAPAILRAHASALMARARQWPPLARSAVVVLTTALLPCGWLYAFVAVAAGTASPARGALAMAVFWTGTLPVMLSLGAGLQRLAGPLRARLPVVTAATVVVLGLLTISGRLQVQTTAGGAVPAARTGHQHP
jgi:sulfite exporter TauE/SafE